MEQQSFLNTEIGQQTIYLMGASFIVGSLVTIFILLILDMLRALRQQAEEGALLQSDPEEALEEGEE